MKKRASLLAITFTFLLLTATLASAADVAYLYRRTFKIDENIVQVFENLGLTIDYIQEYSQPSNYNAYKLIFVGDENFRANIPVNNYPSVIASYYDAEDWGITDNEGVSQLASTHPLSVLINAHQYQVYTQAKIGSVGIPYYYLDLENRAPGMEQVAATETTASGYKFGDVISYAPAGTQMTNGRTQQGDLCFYGIVESDYWTPKARDLFEDCVQYVAAECIDETDCPDTELSDPFCIDDDVYQTETSYTCENGLLAYCESHEQDILIEECDYSCLNGECAGECNNNADCDDQDIWTEDICENPSTPESICTNEPITCHTNQDCGTDGLIGQPTCDGLDVVQDYETFLCSNPGTAQSSCSSSISEQTLETCAEACVDGACQSIDCYNDEDCGTSGLTGDPFCTGDDVYQDYETHICNNPATPQSSCSSSTSPQLQEICADTCVAGRMLYQR